MKTYARQIDGHVVEIIHPVKDEEGKEIPLAKRFHRDFIANLIEYDPRNPPVPPPAPPLTAIQARARRDTLLSVCDWTQLSDVPETTREAWGPYRQALRDVTEQEGFPEAIEWPAAPV